MTPNPNLWPLGSGLVLTHPPAAAADENTLSQSLRTRTSALCDQAKTSLFDLTPHAWTKALEWAGREDEWVKRAGFALMVGLAVHNTAAPDRAFVELLPRIERGAFDPRNFVKKAASWALRNIGKRNSALNRAAVACAERIRAAANERAGGDRDGDPEACAARRVAADALREPTSDRIVARLREKEAGDYRRSTHSR